MTDLERAKNWLVENIGTSRPEWERSLATEFRTVEETTQNRIAAYIDALDVYGSGPLNGEELAEKMIRTGKWRME